MAFYVFAQVLLPILVVVAAGYLLQRRLELDLRSVNLDVRARFVSSVVVVSTVASVFSLTLILVLLGVE